MWSLISGIGMGRATARILHLDWFIASTQVSRRVLPWIRGAPPGRGVMYTVNTGMVVGERANMYWVLFQIVCNTRTGNTFPPLENEPARDILCGHPSNTTHARCETHLAKGTLGRRTARRVSESVSVKRWVVTTETHSAPSPRV